MQSSCALTRRLNRGILYALQVGAKGGKQEGGALSFPGEPIGSYGRLVPRHPTTIGSQGPSWRVWVENQPDFIRGAFLFQRQNRSGRICSAWPNGRVVRLRQGCDDTVARRGRKHMKNGFREALVWVQKPNHPCHEVVIRGTALAGLSSAAREMTSTPHRQSCRIHRSVGIIFSFAFGES